MSRHRLILTLLFLLTVIATALAPIAMALPLTAGLGTRSAARPAVFVSPAEDLLVTFPGNYAAAAGLGNDWAPDNLNTRGTDTNGDGVWKFVTDAIPPGQYEFKVTVGGSWDENYGRNGQRNGPNVPFTVSQAGQTVHFYYDRSDHYVASRPDAIIPVVAGNFLEAIGGQNWAPDHLKSWMKDPDGDGIYTWRAAHVPAGTWEYKVALNESWDVSYPATNRSFTVPAGGDEVTFFYNAVTHEVGERVGAAPPPPLEWALIHYNRPAGDYGTPGPDFNTFWGLHLWGEAIADDEGTTWTSPKPFAGVDDYGAYVAIRLKDPTKPVNYIVHRGNEKDTPADRSFDPLAISELWIKQGDPANYASRAAVTGHTVIHYHRPGGDYAGWGLHLWGDGLAPGVGTDWSTPRMPDGFDDYGAFFRIPLSDPTQPVNFIVHKGDEKDPDRDRSYIPAHHYQVWLQSGDAAVYAQRGAAEDFALIHYRRSAGDYDGWGLHVWTGSAEPGVTWQNPLPPAGRDDFGIFWKVRLVEGATQLAYIIHRGDEKDPGPDQFLIFADKGYEIWQIQGSGEQYTNPAVPTAVLARAFKGNLGKQQAHWVRRDTIAWAQATGADRTYTLHYDANAGLTLDKTGIQGGQSITLTYDPAGLDDAIKAQFPHLAGLGVLKIAPADLPLVPTILKGQFAVQAQDAQGNLVDATGLQIPGVLDDLYTYTGELGVSWQGETPTIRVWAPTAQTVRLHRFVDANPATPATVHEMTYDAATGVWSITGEPGWKGQYYLFEVRVFAPTTGRMETNLVTDPYSLSLAMNSTRSQIVDLADPALAPPGWHELSKPPLVAPEDITIYELHVRDFSANDPSVPEALKGTYKAFTLPDSHGVRHLKALQAAGLTHIHLLPVFDIATINEDRSQWQEPDPALMATFPPDSDQQQALLAPVRDLDGYNWGYDPLHYTVPEGSYSTDPNGVTRIIEFREMVAALNRMGLRVVMDVVYNHTNASGQSPNAVLDRIVPGYYHRLNKDGQVETSTCCANTASEHAMFEKLMVDSLVTWAKYYKIDGFRFDLMGHHMKRNMLRVRAALDALTPEQDGVDGRAIYLYGEGWNFGEVANNARGENATQLNMAGTGIGTFSDRLRDAVRGIGPFDSGQDLLRKQGFANGMYYDPKPTVPGTPAQQLQTLLLQTDQIRVGMAGNLADYVFEDRTGRLVRGAQVDYFGQPAGYTRDPQENISYIDKHDNQTLFDVNIFAAPETTSMADRVRMEHVGRSTILLGQGIPFIHAGGDLLRSKSLDRDSYNSGDWFNKIDWTYQNNNFGVGLPPAWANAASWDVMRPFLADPNLKPGPADIALARDLFRELLRIRYSSPLFRLRTAWEIQARVAFHNTGPNQLPGLIVMTLSDRAGPDLDPNAELIVVLINANDEAQTFDSPLEGRRLVLHPVQQNSVDPIVKTATFDPGSGVFTVPGRTTAVWVEPQLGADAFVTFPGNYVAQLGGHDWDPADVTTRASDDNGDQVWTFTTPLSLTGTFEFKATVGGSWAENYGRHGQPNGPNLSFTADNQVVRFYYDRADNYVASRPGTILPVVAGNFGDEIGGQDWNPANLTTWMKDRDGDGIYTYQTAAIPPGTWEYKVALNESWDENYPASNRTFTVPYPGAIVTFSFDSASKDVSETVTPLVAQPPTGLLVTFPGNYAEAAGLGSNWDPANEQTRGTDANNDGVWKFVTNRIPAGSYEFKVTVGGSWAENYGLGGRRDGPNVPFTVSQDGQTVHFYYDRGSGDHWVASRPDSRIVVLVGNMMDEVGGAEWAPDNLKGWMKDKDGDGNYEITLRLPAGSYAYKVAINESWDENYGANGERNGPDIPLVVPEDDTEVTFVYNDTTHVITHTLPQPPQPPQPVTVELPLLADTWVNGGAKTTNYNTYAALIARTTGLDNVLLVFDRSPLPIGADIISATLTVTVTLESGAPRKMLIVHNSDPFNPATVTYKDLVRTFNPGTPVPVALGPRTFDVRSQVRGCDTMTTTGFAAQASAAGVCYLAISAAGLPGRVAMHSLESWPRGSHPRLRVTYIAGTGVTPEEAALVRPAVRHPLANETFYFVLTDRFDNGDPTNDYGGDSGDTDADVIRHGYRPTDKAFYHGGDFAGLQRRLDYLQGLGVTALWITPPLVNKPTQPDSTTALGVGAGYHGYWILDYENADPHLGTNQELKALVDAAHARGMKVFFDLVVNHTADVIVYEGGESRYRSKAEYPYRDAAGHVFDDRDYVGGTTFPPLDPAISFPYRPTFRTSQDAALKNPAWLNNPIYYHNRGDTTFRGENSLYGDFFGMDDLFTEHPDVVNGFIAIAQKLIRDYDIDGFRLDTVKHVNLEFWTQFAPAVIAYGRSRGKPDFALFGEVFGEDPAFRSRYTGPGRLPAVLDFGLHGAGIGFAVSSNATDNLRGLFESDDYYTDPDSNAYSLGNFISNHDMGRIGYQLQTQLPGRGDEEWLARARLGHALTFFARGFPILYYGDEQGFTGDGGDKGARQDMMPSRVPEYNDDDLIGTEATTADANFDPSHPLYQTLRRFAELRGRHAALRTGAQIHRYSTNGAGIYAFSRLDREQRVEYLVVLNNATTTQTATFTTASPDTDFRRLYPDGGTGIASDLHSDAEGRVTVTVPGLDLALYQATRPISPAETAPIVQFRPLGRGGQLTGRAEIGVTVTGSRFAEVTFAVRTADDTGYTVLGTDDNPPYRVFYDVSKLPPGTALTFTAIANDGFGRLNAATTTATVGTEAPPAPPSYAIIHYHRPDGAYDEWGLHLWGDGLAPEEVTDWHSPKAWNGEDDYGVFAFIQVVDPTQPVGYIIHKGDEKDTPNDRFFTPALTPDIWTVQGSAANYPSSAAALSRVTIHYRRPGGDYEGWGLHLWGEAIDPSEATEWAHPKLPDGFDDYGAYFHIRLADPSKPVNFIVHKGDEKDTPNDRSFVPNQTGLAVWLRQGDAAHYRQRGAVEGYALLHYRRHAGDYGDYTSTDFRDFWGLHVWGDTTETVSWQAPLKPVATDRFGVVFRVRLTAAPTEIGYIFHRGDSKDPGPDQFLNFAEHGYEIWQLQGADPERPFLIPRLP